MKELIFNKGNTTVTVTNDTVITVEKDTLLEFDIATLGFVYGYGFNLAELTYPLNSLELTNDNFCVSNIQCPV